MPEWLVKPTPGPLERRAGHQAIANQVLEASPLAPGGMVAIVLIDARARFEAAYRTAALDFDLPACEALVGETQPKLLIALAEEACKEISLKRQALISRRPEAPNPS